MITAAALKGSVITLLTFVGNRFIKMMGGAKNDSLASLTSAARVEPIALVDKLLTHQPYMQDLIQVANSTYIGYYLQGVALYGTSINGARALDTLSALNPTRDVKNAAATLISDSIDHPSMLSLESYRYRLPAPGEKLGMESFGMEAAVQDRFKNRTVEEQNAFDRKERAGAAAKAQGSARDNKLMSSLREAVDLSVGRMFEVNLVQDGKDFTVPVMVRTIVTVIESDMLAHILGGSGRSNSLKERYWAWKEDRLELIRDNIFMRDLIVQHKRNLLKDNTGVFREIMRRRRDNTISGFISGSPSIGTASNIVVMSKRTADTLEKAENGRLSDTAFRNRVFKDTYILLMFVVDEEYERVTIYHRDVALPTQLSIKELRASSKSGADPMEILKAYQLGSAVRY